MCGKPAIGGLREREEHEWVLFLRDPSVVRGLGQGHSRQTREEMLVALTSEVTPRKSSPSVLSLP